MSNTENCVEKHIIAHIDILGSSTKILNGELTHETMIEIYKKSLDLNYYYQKDSNRSCKIRIFSDNIIFAHELPQSKLDDTNCDAYSEALECIYVFVSSFADICNNRGLLVRGGITIGDFYIDDIIVWGKGLLRAYELESKIAIYPRIIFDQSVVDLNCELKKLMYFHEDSEEKYFKKDIDNINFLPFGNKFNITGFDSLIALYTEELKKIKNDKVQQKYNWFINHLYSINDFGTLKKDKEAL